MHWLIAGILFAGWFGWGLPFFFIRRHGNKPQQLDRRARWGMVIQGVAFALVWQGKWRIAATGTARLAIASAFFVLAITLSWMATRSLGKQWRFDAGVNAGHELVRAGAYRFVRHPIYLSMLCLLVGTGLLFVPLTVLAIAIIVHVAGTEIRVRIEDRLLAARFGDRFREYQRTVPAYLPFVR